tara:strand:- start:229 stop:750 length:522 start_codon:yes stop_codon:yes gene_type:complete
MEENRQIYINKVINALGREAKSLTYIPNKHNLVDAYALTEEELDYLFEVEGQILDRFKGMQFNTADYQSSGGYDFKFSITNITSDEHSSEGVIKDIVWEIDAYVNLDGATVTLFTTGEEEKLWDAIDNPDIGWEIESEIKEVIRDILMAESPLLKALGSWITVEQNYWGLGST